MFLEHANTSGTINTDGIDAHLSSAIDNLVRTFYVEKTFDGYSQGKFHCAIHHFQQFVHSIQPDPFFQTEQQTAIGGGEIYSDQA